MSPSRAQSLLPRLAAAARDAAAEVRAGLADLLALGADAFARIEVDPDRLIAQVRGLPNGLFPR